MRKAGGRKTTSSKSRVVDTDVALSSRVRLARNLAGERFPDWASEDDRDKVLWTVRDTLFVMASEMHPYTVAHAGVRECEVLCEKHLISRDLMARKDGSGMVISEDATISIMINEEDHLRIQGFAPGLDIGAAWRRADKMDARLELALKYAYSHRLGYLTACPSNIGTGLRASAMLHLLGLRLLGEIDAVVRGLERLRLMVRGVGGEGTEAAGQIYQVSNMVTLGVNSTGIVRHVERICGEVVRQERNARRRLQRGSPRVLEDCLARSLSMLQNARLLTTGEALDFLSALRLGASLGLCENLDIAGTDRLILWMQPGHLQRAHDRELSPEERDALRADFLNRELAYVKLNCGRIL